MTEPEKKKSYLCTRPKLMADLIEQGFTCTQTINPFNPKYTAWLFSIDNRLALAVSDYFNRNNLKIPASISDYLAAAAGTEVQP